MVLCIMGIKLDNTTISELQKQISLIIKEFLESQNIYCKMNVSVLQSQELDSIIVEIKSQTQDKIIIDIHEIN